MDPFGSLSDLGHLFGTADLGHLFGTADLGHLFGTADLGHLFGTVDLGHLFGTADLGHLFGAATARCDVIRNGLFGSLKSPRCAVPLSTFVGRRVSSRKTGKIPPVKGTSVSLF